MNWCLSLLHKSLGSRRKWPRFQREDPLHCVWRLIHLYICEATVCLSEACFLSASVDGDWRHAEPEEIQPRWPQEWKGHMVKIFKSEVTNRRYSCLALQWIRIADSSLSCCSWAIFKSSHLTCFLTVFKLRNQVFFEVPQAGVLCRNRKLLLTGRCSAVWFHY